MKHFCIRLNRWKILYFCVWDEFNWADTVTIIHKFSTNFYFAIEFWFINWASCWLIQIWKLRADLLFSIHFWIAHFLPMTDELFNFTIFFLVFDIIFRPLFVQSPLSTLWQYFFFLSTMNQLFVNWLRAHKKCENQLKNFRVNDSEHKNRSFFSFFVFVPSNIECIRNV